MPQALLQIRNQEQNRILSADFQPRYEPNFAWKSLASTLLALPMLRGAWVSSVSGDAATVGSWWDISGMANRLVYNGNPTFNCDSLVPYWDYDGTGDWHNRGDEGDLDILGTETYVAAAIRGLTMGGWFWPDRDTQAETLIGKWNAVGNQKSYRIMNNSGAFLAQVSVDGAANTNQGGGAVTTGQWYYLVLRFVPSTTLDFWVNSTKNTLAAGVPASIFNSTSDFRVAANGAGTENYDGRASACFLCAAAHSDAIIMSLFEQTRAAYNV